MKNDPVVVIGAGIGGLSAAIALAGAGIPVRVFEKAPVAGGKMREVAAGDKSADAGPTVFTMRWVFEELFSGAGKDFDSYLTTRQANLLARHGWSDGSALDLFANRDRSADAIGAFAGAREADAYRAFCAEAEAIFDTLKDTFIAASRPSVFGLAHRIGLGNIDRLRAIKPFSTLWKALGTHFRDPRLHQLFGRYATYCGSSPYQAPATLMLVAHVEAEGVWLVDDGMISVARALTTCAQDLGVTFDFDTEVSEINCESGRATGIVTGEDMHVAASAVIANADPGAFAAGRFGAEAARAVRRIAPKHRSLSAVTWAFQADTSGFPLSRHNVFFSDDYAREFREICEGLQLPGNPTVYVCAQDRDDAGKLHTEGPERMMCLVNAPATGDTNGFEPREIEECETAMLACLDRSGLKLDNRSQRQDITTPATFAQMFPGSGGALYGPASHGWAASFRRAGSRTRLADLYLAGGGVHPGPGVPMAALSGRLAAAAVMADRTSR